MEKKDKNFSYKIMLDRMVYPGWEEQKEKETENFLEYNNFKEANEVIARIMEIK